MGLIASCAHVLGCASNAPPEQVRRELGPQWQDVFDGTPDIYAVVRPRALQRDAVYGAFFKNALRVAQARSSMRGATALEALEGAEEIVFGTRKDAQGDDAALVIRGVPANLDPQKMTDSLGRPLLRLLDGRARVPEYAYGDREDDVAGSVFVLPDRTWVGVLGDARARARAAFASPFGRPAPSVDAAALAVVRFDAGAFMKITRVTRSPLVGPLTKKLRALSFALMPGSGGVVAQLQYDDDDASAWAELHVVRMLEELSREEPRRSEPSRAWLRTAQVGHEGRRVIVRIAVPARLLEDLPSATGRDFGFL